MALPSNNDRKQNIVITGDALQKPPLRYFIISKTLGDKSYYLGADMTWKLSPHKNITDCKIYHCTRLDSYGKASVAKWCISDPRENSFVYPVELIGYGEPDKEILYRPLCAGQM